MTPIESRLLDTCLDDLHDGLIRLEEALKGLTDTIDDPDLVALARTLHAQARLQRVRVADLRPASDDPPPNLWMSGIVDDARRDAETQPAGWSRDVALAGALRKAVGATRISSETALAIAARRDLPIKDAIRHNQDEQWRMESDLGEVLTVIVKQPPEAPRGDRAGSEAAQPGRRDGDSGD